MIKRTAVIIILITFCLLMPAAGLAQTDGSEKLPEIWLKDLQGKTIGLDKYKGKVILMNFWATWCVPCRAEVPELVEWQKKYEKNGLQVIGVTYPPTSNKRVLDFIRKNKVNYPILIGSKKTKGLFDKSDTLPFSVVIDKDGRIEARIEGIIYDEEFEEKIKPLLDFNQRF